MALADANFERIASKSAITQAAYSSPSGQASPAGFPTHSGTEGFGSSTSVFSSAFAQASDSGAKAMGVNAMGVAVLGLGAMLL